MIGIPTSSYWCNEAFYKIALLCLTHIDEGKQYSSHDAKVENVEALAEHSLEYEVLVWMSSLLQKINTKIACSTSILCVKRPF